MPIKILMPALSPTMAEGNLVRWLKSEGDQLKSGDVLAEIETDKATMEVEAVDEGKLAKILVPAGTENVKVNEVIAILLEEGEDSSSLDSVSNTQASPNQEIPVTKKLEEVKEASIMTTPSVGASKDTQERIFASPLARRVASNNQIDLATLQGSGPRGRIIKADVEAAVSNKPQSSQVSTTTSYKAADDLYPAYEEVKVSNMRKVIAQRLTESKQNVPHFYLTVECEIDELLNFRKQINKSLPESERISVNDLIIKAISVALKKVPDANASWIEGGYVRRYQHADVSVAVAVEGGLVTPIVRGAELKSILEISREMKELISKARAGKLKPQEFQGGTFSLSNLGMYGIKNFSAVINPPQGCILAVGAGEELPIVRDGKVEIATIMGCTLSVDHRVVDGAVGAEFLKVFKNLITNPVLMLI
ncbi:MAG: pyruvate dehydrogenase complex dihydrolipoamide acetyltransferase [Caedibacter sp. 38-128]|nr:pyruvate dehydrogenase complex dihydrolipoamide acetyltransferase [Holosporales bacterium]OJX03527.1 MAG: pyruvate dehydrogenase complex dihydrolipoamide acetyltransferase [Caedibacter sp. 38-128]